MSERSELFSLPDLCLPAPGTPKGLRPSGRLLLLTFLGEARKVSGCRATPGKPSLIEERKESATQAKTDQALTNLNLVISEGANNLLGGPQYPVPRLVYTHRSFKRFNPAT